MKRRPYRLAGTTTKAVPSGLATTGGQVRTADEITALVQQAVAGAATPLPRDPFPYAFGPGTPLLPAPLDPTGPSGRAEPRIYEYPVSWNLPGSASRLVPWRTLRDAATLPLIRDCIRIRKAEVSGLDWDITLSRRAVEAAQRVEPGTSRLDVEQKLRTKLAPEIDRAIRFWTCPDPGNGYTFTEWISQFLEEHLVLDAVAIYPRRNLGGDLYALEVLDGATIKPLLDHRGGRPMPPQPAYQQVLHGFPRGEFTADTSDTDGETVIPAGYAADQLIYIRREVRTHTPYGLSPVEQALSDIDLWMKRVSWLRSEYTDGVMPSGWLRWLGDGSSGTPWTPAQIREYETQLNDYLAGNTAARHRWRVLPPGLIPDESGATEAERYKPEFDMHLLKLVVAHFDLTVHELGFTEAKGLGSSGHAEGQEALGARKGTGPTLKWLASLITDMSRAHLGLPAELEFRWLDLEDASAETDSTASAVAAGLLTLNEGRDEIGRPRFTFPDADKPAIISGSTVAYLEGASEPKPAPPQLAPFTGQPNQPVIGDKPAGPKTGDPGGEPKEQADGEDANADAAKAAEAAAYRRWAAKGRSGRRFVLNAIASPSDLVRYDIDPAHVTLAKAGDTGPKARGPLGSGTLR